MKANIYRVMVSVLVLAGVAMFSCQKAGAPAKGTLDKVKARGKLLAGVKFDFKPFGYLNEKGENEGFDVEMAQYLGKKIGVPVELVKVTSESRIPDLLAGKVDLVIASMTHNITREAQIDFSTTYFQDGQSLLVRKGEKIKGLKDLAGKTVAAVRGATSSLKLVSFVPQAKLLLYDEYPAALKALERGMVDALTTDRSYCVAAAADNPDLEVAGPAFTVEPYGIGVRENDSKWREAVNLALMQMELDGTYEKIYKKYFHLEPGFRIEVLPGAGI
ncbi:MAG: transporter substrate-binding domain-containing protein [bacterium]|nr:transporter substrate-binding domain-containing protein [bacterium]